MRSIALSSQGGERVAQARVDVPASDSYNDDGTFRNTSPAHKGAEFLVQMRYVKSQWRLVSFSAGLTGYASGACTPPSRRAAP